MPRSVIAVSSLIMACLVVGPAPGGEVTPSAGVRLFDTRAASAKPLIADAFSKTDSWQALGETDQAHAFKGDAVLHNGRLAVVLRRTADGAEIYSLGGDGARLRARLVPMGARAAGALETAAVAECSPARAAVEAAFSSAGGPPIRLRFELTVGQVFVTAHPMPGVKALRVEAPCRFAVLPDFFADDLVIDAADLPVTTAEVPADHFALQMLGGGDAAVMTVWKADRMDDLRLQFSGGDSGTRQITAIDVPVPDAGKALLAVAVLSGRGVWYTADIPEQEVQKGKPGPVIDLDWTAPFPGQWRVDWRRPDGLVDSWEMAVEQGDGTFLKPGWFGSPVRLPGNRKRWTTVLGNFFYPCWIDQGSRGHLQPVQQQWRLGGPVVLYPINRSPDTPLDAFTVVDIVRATLGVGPCEYVLDVEGQRSQYKGRATCGVRDVLNPIYSKGLQKKERQTVLKTLDEATTFLAFIRGRIDDYVAFGHETLDYLAARKQAHPDLATHIAELETLAQQIDRRVAGRSRSIRTPADHAKMIAEFRETLLDYEGPDAANKCQQWTRDLVNVGGNQDELVGECRLAVRVLRQRAALIAAREPKMASLAAELRDRTQKILRNPASHEAARH